MVPIGGGAIGGGDGVAESLPVVVLVITMVMMLVVGIQ